MANPNIVGLNTISGISTGIALTTTPTVFISNPTSSNKVIKVNDIIISNTSASYSNAYVRYLPTSSVGAGISFGIAGNVGISTGSSLVALDKASSIYLNENQSLTAYASANSTLELVASFEEIS